MEISGIEFIGLLIGLLIGVILLAWGIALIAVIIQWIVQFFMAIYLFLTVKIFGIPLWVFIIVLRILIFFL